MKARIEAWMSSLLDPGRPDEFEAKRLLAELGIGVPRGLRLEAGETVGSPPFGGPFVVKLCGAEFEHKTDLGGVRVGLTADEIGPAIDGLRERFPHASMLIEEQVEGASAELIVGGIVDPSFGPAVMVGSGGILTELVEDVSFRLAPCTAAEAHRMIAELLIAPLFRGYRGLRLDAGGLATTIETVSLLILDLGQRLERLDINPIVFAGGRWIALDAKIGLHLAGASAIEREEENH